MKNTNAVKVRSRIGSSNENNTIEHPLTTLMEKIVESAGYNTHTEH